jgi:Rod binding domain-containing protein
MSSGLSPMGAGLPPIDPTFEPASVRNGSPATQKAYTSALNFESMLVQQLSQSLTESGGLGGEGESEGEGGGEGGGGNPVNTQLSSLLPQTLTNSVMSHGGLGMAQQLMGSLLAETSSKISPTGGVKA